MKIEEIKKIMLLLFVFIIVSTIVLAFPMLMEQQGILRNSTTGELISGSFLINYTLYNYSNNNMVYSENRTITINSGVWDYQIGLIAPIVPSIFEYDSLYLVPSINNTNLSKVNLTTTPYSFYSFMSNNTKNLGSYIWSSFVNNTNLENNITDHNTSIKSYVDNNFIQNSTSINLTKLTVKGFGNITSNLTIGNLIINDNGTEILFWSW